MASIPEMIHGAKPEVAPFVPTDPIEMLNKLLAGEITAWPQITALSDLYQNYMLGAYEEAIPGFRDILAQGGVDTRALLGEAEPLIRGEIPEDVRSEVLRSAAYQGLTSGTLGGPMGATIGPRALGLTSLDLMTKGANLLTAGGNAAQRWAGLAQGTMLPPSSQLYSPEWFTNFMAQQAAAKQATQQYKYNVAAAPDPVAAGIAGTLLNFAGLYAGKGMGGGGGNMIPAYNQPGGSPVNPTTATVGGWNTPWGTNVGGQNIPYMSPAPGASDVSTPGYYLPESIPAATTTYNTMPYQYNIPPNPWGT
jgi:hypothetical protein